MKKVGVLALQGDFEAHEVMLRRLGADTIQVRTPEELQQIEGLVIPGGESTTMLRLLDVTGMEQPIKEFGREKPIFGTCAGAILLANEVTNPEQRSLQLCDLGVERNAYGRQLDSRVVRLQPEPGALPGGELEAVFIRAPIIRRIGKDSRVLARYEGVPVLVEQGKHLIATFHPELTNDPRVHELFLEKV